MPVLTERISTRSSALHTHCNNYFFIGLTKMLHGSNLEILGFDHLLPVESVSDALSVELL